MSIEISRQDIADVEAMLYGIKNGAVRVLTVTLNKTLTSVKSQAAKEVADGLNLTQARIKKNFGKSYNANYSNMSAGFICKGKPVSLGEFSNTRQTKQGVSVQVKKESGSRKIIKHSFLGHIWHKPADEKDKVKKQVGQRVLPHYEGPRKDPWERATYDKNHPYPQYGMLPFKYRWPVKRLTGPRVEDELGKPAVIARVMAHADERLDVIMEQEIKYTLDRHRNRI